MADELRERIGSQPSQPGEYAVIEEARETLKGPYTLTWPQIERLRATATTLADALSSALRERAAKSPEKEA